MNARASRRGELSAEERFRNFFSTSVIDLPEEMTRRDEPAPVRRKSPRPGCWASCSATIKNRLPPPHSRCWRSPPVRSCWGGRCKAGAAGAGGHGAGTAYRRPCSGNADAARQPRACQGSSGRAGACAPRRLLPCSRSRKARAPSRCRSLLQPPKSSLRRRTPRDAAAAGGTGAAGDAAAEGYAQRHERQGKACPAARKARTGSAAACSRACTACGRAGESPGKGCTERRRGVAAGGVCQRAGRTRKRCQKAGEKVYFPDVRHGRGRKARCPQAGKKRIL